MAAVKVKKILDLVPELLKVPYSRMWTAYDKEADVLYINFKKPSHADNSELTDDDIIIRYEKGRERGRVYTLDSIFDPWYIKKHYGKTITH